MKGSVFVILPEGAFKAAVLIMLNGKGIAVRVIQYSLPVQRIIAEKRLLNDNSLRVYALITSLAGAVGDPSLHSFRISKIIDLFHEFQPGKRLEAPGK